MPNCRNRWAICAGQRRFQGLGNHHTGLALDRYYCKSVIRGQGVMVPLKVGRVWVEFMVNRGPNGEPSPLGLGDGVLAQVRWLDL